MPNFALNPTPKWRRPTITIPFFGVVKKPVSSSYLTISSESAAKWLVDNQYCSYVAISSPPEEPEKIPVRQVVLGKDNTLELEPPLQVGVPGTGEEYLIRFFHENTSAEINKAIRSIPIAKAEELKAVEPLTWDEVVRILTEKQLEAAGKWAADKS